MVEVKDEIETSSKQEMTPEQAPTEPVPVVEIVEVEPQLVPPAEVGAAERAAVPWGWRTIVRWTLVTLAILGVGWVLWTSSAALTPFIIGLVMAYLMVPAVDRFARRMPRWAAILLVYTFTFGALGIGLAYIIPPAVNQVNEVITSVPEWYTDGQGWAQTLIARFQTEVSPDVQQQVEEQIAKIQETIQANASSYTQRVAGFLFSSVLRIFQTLTFLLGFLIIPFFLFYILLDSNRLPKAINQMIHPHIRADFWNILRIVDTIFGKYIRGQLILGLIVGVMSFVGLQGLNMAGYEVRFTLLLAIVAAIGELIPVVGPILSAIPAIIVGATDGGGTALAVAILYVVIQQVENQVLVPRIVGSNLRLHAALLMALLVIASQIGGLFLVILVAPLTAIVRDVFVYLHQRLEEPPVQPQIAIKHALGDDGTEDAKAPSRPIKTVT